MPRIRVPPPYRGPTQGAASVEVEGETLGDCLRAAEARHPGFLEQVVGPGGELHRFVRLAVNGRALKGAKLDEVDEALGPEDEIEVVAAIAGG